ncbi:hypothetical protein KKHLCK_12595 [Candidatus Electrothrix laxa]
MENQGLPEPVNQVRGFFLPASSGRLHVYIIQGRFAMTASEQAYCKIALFLLTDWDSFQVVMRGGLRQLERKETAQGATDRATDRPERK